MELLDFLDTACFLFSGRISHVDDIILWGLRYGRRLRLEGWLLISSGFALFVASENGFFQPSVWLCAGVL